VYVYFPLCVQIPYLIFSSRVMRWWKTSLNIFPYAFSSLLLHLDCSINFKLKSSSLPVILGSIISSSSWIFFSICESFSLLFCLLTFIWMKLFGFSVSYNELNFFLCSSDALKCSSWTLFLFSSLALVCHQNNDTDNTLHKKGTIP